MSAYFEKGRRQDIRNGDMSKFLKLAAIKIAYMEIKSIEINYINTHSLIDRGVGGGGGFCVLFSLLIR